MPAQPSEGGAFGRFTLRRELGRGATAVVWEAWDPQAERAVALKVLYRAQLVSEDLHERFRRETEALGRLQHPHVIRVFEAGSWQGTPYAALELVAGGSLHQAFERGVDLAVGLELVDQIAQALEAAHRVGIVHRDLKPGNVLLDELGRARVADFGLARLEGASIDLTRTGDVLGTPRFMAPEQMRGLEVGPAADVWSLGGILHQLLAGAPPYARCTTPAELAAAVKDPRPVPPPSSVRAGVPPQLVALCLRALEKDPAARIDLAGFRAALRVAWAGPAPAPPRRPPPRWLLPALGALALTLPLAVLLPDRRPDPAEPPAAGAAPASRSTGPLVETPAWWRRLPPAERAPLPLPEGVAFGSEPGVYLNQRDGSSLLFVPGGSFLRGSGEGEGDPWEAPARRIELSPYFIGRDEVTVGQFRRFVAATGHRTVCETQGGGLVFLPPELQTPGSGYFGAVLIANWRDGEGDRAPDHEARPVTQVTPLDADEYVRWAGLRLPSEAEWERAAGWDAALGRARRYPWGDDMPHAGSERVANLSDERAHALWPSADWVEGYDDGHARAAPVGSFLAGSSPVGARDMGGNVAEVCADGFEEGWNASSPERDPLRPPDPGPDALRAVRGGAFFGTPQDSRTCARWKAEQAEFNEKLGFRVARSAR